MVTVERETKRNMKMKERMIDLKYHAVILGVLASVLVPLYLVAATLGV
tara:strand:+ start:1242 stop:1385 length:144 start_codon:yes stop_codon:yes gene_type:complete